MISKRLALATFCCASLFSQVGFAQDPSAVAAADVLFKQGKQLHDEKRYSQACPKFAESYRLDPATGSLLALASCHEGEGKLASAWSEYNELMARARKEGQPQRVEVARQRANALEPKLAKLTISLPPSHRAPGMQIKRGSVLLGEGSIGVALPVDRGEVVVDVSAPGYQSFTTRIMIADGSVQVVTIPALTPVPGTASAPSSSNATAAGTGESSGTRASFADQPAKPQTEFPTRTIGIVAIVGGVIAAGAGTYFGISALGKKADSNANGHCQGDMCDGEGTRARRDAVSAGNLSTALFVTSGVLAAGGLTLFVLGGSKKDPAAAKLVPAVGRNAAGLSMQGVF